MTIDRDKVMKLLKYDRKTGLFSWRVDVGRWGRIKAGSQAGCLCGTWGYIIINIGGVTYRAHRLAWLILYGRWPNGDIDHKNHVRSDNKLLNLREVSHACNLKNQKLRETNTTGIMGVVRSKGNNWTSGIWVDNKSKYLGFHKDFFEACCSRKSAENKYGFHENHGKL